MEVDNKLEVKRKKKKEKEIRGCQRESQKEGNTVKVVN